MTDFKDLQNEAGKAKAAAMTWRAKAIDFAVKHPKGMVIIVVILTAAIIVAAVR